MNWNYIILSSVIFVSLNETYNILLYFLSIRNYYGQVIFSGNETNMGFLTFTLMKYIHHTNVFAYCNLTKYFYHIITMC